MPGRPLVYVVTLNWNGCQDTLACLDSLQRLTYPNARVLVVDNGSSDGSVQTIAAAFPRVEQLQNDRNLGYAAGMNTGLRLAVQRGAEWVFVLNNDATVAPDVLEPLLEAAAPLDVGLAGSLTYYAEARDRVWSSGGGRSALTLEMTGNHGRDEHLAGITEREYVSACAMLIKAATLERVGLFDERFFMYYEDGDFCLRVRQAGLRVLVVPRSHVWHKGGASSDGVDSPAERYWMARSSVIYFRKHVRGWRWLIVLPYRAASGLKTTWRSLAAGRLPAAAAYWRGIWHGITR